MSWLKDIASEVARSGPLVRVLVAAADGSTPREAGAAMLVWPDRTSGTIGGGALELAAVSLARELLDSGAHEPWQRVVRGYPLGPSLGQCCGGHARLLFERYGPAELPWLEPGGGPGDDGLVVRPMASGVPLTVIHSRKAAPDWPLPVLRVARQMLAGERARAVALIDGRKGQGAWLIEPARASRLPLYLYGAGHVGRAVVRALTDLPFAITWIDTGGGRFPAAVPDHARMLVAADPAAIAATAPAAALHLVMTYSHAIDLAICHAVLTRRRFRWLGLIGSATKRARFAKRLREAGTAEAELARMVCPIGLPDLRGKEPAVIAISVAAQLLQVAAAGAQAGAVGEQSR